MPSPLLIAAGAVIGVVFGLFGAGGSAFATPILVLMGVPGALAVASPLPAMLPASLAGARRYLRNGMLDLRTAKRTVAGGLPGTVIGALASAHLPGGQLIALSAVLLLVLGGRLLLPDSTGAAARGAARLEKAGFVVGAAFVVGFLTGLLANGGGFLLVPLFVLVLGLPATVAAGTSMVAVGILIVPTLLMHAWLGHIDWPVALLFGIGVLPGSQVGAYIANHVPAGTTRKGFGLVLVGFSIWFLATH